MWLDNETGVDYLNFGSIALTVAEIIEQANNQPVSIGVSGAWGVGKSSMIKLIEEELKQKDSLIDDEKKKYLFVNFNAWLYQGYDDARAALIEVVATELMKEAKSRESVVDKAGSLLKRVDWFRTTKLVATVGAPMLFGLPPIGLLGEAWDMFTKVKSGSVDQEALNKVGGAVNTATESTSSLLKPKTDTTPPKQIEELRQNLVEVLQDLKITLIVLIDDLDRCLPETTVSTLEAIRLLLFLENTAFVIAADDQMIKHAVKKHFNGVDDDLVINYFDKLIQVPIRVPPLGTQEVRAYMMMLFIQGSSSISYAEKENLRLKIAEQLTKSWQGKRVDSKFVKGLNPNLPSDLVSRLHVADQLASVMTTSNRIAGNPRLIKRFLNALSIRMAMSKAQGVGVEEVELIKIMLFERCGNPKAYAELVKMVSESDDGKPSRLGDWETKISKGEIFEPEANWEDPFVVDWLRLDPKLADRDLRGSIYLSREHAPLITAEDRLSSEAAELLESILEHPDMAESAKEELRALPNKSELSVMMERLLGVATKVGDWGTPDILTALLVIAELDASQAARLSIFLQDRPIHQIKANIVPKISDRNWAKEVFEIWIADDALAAPVKSAISIKSRKKQ